MLDNRPDRAPRIDELRFQYQPIVPLSPDEPGWSEALVRWQLDDGTIRGPNDVLPHWLASARLEVFTRFSLERAAVALAAHPDALVSVNLSPTQVTHPTTLPILEGLLPDIRSRLRIELTEQRFFDTAALWSSLELIRERCSIVLLDDITQADIDTRLPANCPVDGIKLDRSVIDGLVDPDKQPALERLVREVTGRFPIVVAEGVEDPAWCDRLRELGVSHVQGFGIGRPRPDLVTPRLHGSHGTGTRGMRLNLGDVLMGGAHSELSD